MRALKDEDARYVRASKDEDARRGWVGLRTSEGSYLSSLDEAGEPASPGPDLLLP